MKHKKLFVTLGATFALFLAIITAASFYLVDYALVSVQRDRDSDMSKIEKRFPEVKPWLDSLQAAGALRDTFVVMPQTGKRPRPLRAFAACRGTHRCARAWLRRQSYKHAANSAHL